MVAFEAARQLLKQGFDVKGLVLIDSPCPINHVALPDSVIKRILEPYELNGRHDSAKDLVTEFRHNAALLEAYQPFELSGREHGSYKTVMLQSQETFDTMKLCGVSYDWLSSRRCRDEFTESWKTLVRGPFEVLPIPGNHFQAFDAQNLMSFHPYTRMGKLTKT